VSGSALLPLPAEQAFDLITHPSNEKVRGSIAWLERYSNHACHDFGMHRHNQHNPCPVCCPRFSGTWISAHTTRRWRMMAAAGKGPCVEDIRTAGLMPT
jgi:hypothetical protein